MGCLEASDPNTAKAPGVAALSSLREPQPFRASGVLHAACLGLKGQFHRRIRELALQRVVQRFQRASPVKRGSLARALLSKTQSTRASWALMRMLWRMVAMAYDRPASPAIIQQSFLESINGWFTQTRIVGHTSRGSRHQ